VWTGFSRLGIAPNSGFREHSNESPVYRSRDSLQQLNHYQLFIKFPLHHEINGGTVYHHWKDYLPVVLVVENISILQPVNIWFRTHDGVSQDDRDWNMHSLIIVVLIRHVFPTIGRVTSWNSLSDENFWCICLLAGLSVIRSDVTDGKKYDIDTRPPYL
jgi:hypothetical protein